MRIDNDISVLDEMMRDLGTAPAIYQPGNYWKVYEPAICREIKSLDLNELRSAVLPSGTVRSFGGGSEIMRFSGDQLYPWDSIYDRWEEKLPVRALYWLAAQIARAYQPFRAFSHERLKNGKRYIKELMDSRRRQAYALASALDRTGRLSQVEDTCLGNPELIEINGRKYSLQFLDRYVDYSYMARWIPFSQIEVVMELGSGIGMQASVLAKAEPHLKIIIVDIPPQLYVSQQYLSAVFPGEVLTYHNTRGGESLTMKAFNNYRIICLAPWDLERISTPINLFINARSFQEMERVQVVNYLSHVSRFPADYVYLNNLTSGHYKAREAGKRGVLEPASMDFMIKELETNYIVKDRRIAEHAQGRDENHEQVVLRRVGSEIGE